MDVGIDSYSYHRLYGDCRPGETPAPSQWPLGTGDALAHARALDVDWLFLETCFLRGPAESTAELGAQRDAPRTAFSWGHGWPPGAPHGLHGGHSIEAQADLEDWLNAAAALGHRLMRITAGSPATRGDEPFTALRDRLVEPLRVAADLAARYDVVLALENHGDLRATELVELLTEVQRDNLGVCLDNVNLLRVHDDHLEGARMLAPWCRVVQLKDCLPGDPTVPGGPVSTPLGEGSLDLDRLLGVLDDQGFEGPVCVEIATLPTTPIDELELVERSVHWLRAHLRRGSRAF